MGIINTNEKDSLLNFLKSIKISSILNKNSKMAPVLTIYLNINHKHIYNFTDEISVNTRFDGKKHVLLSLPAIVTFEWNSSTTTAYPRVSFRTNSPM